MSEAENNASAFKGASANTPAPIYEIRVKGCMDEVFWSDWFGGMDVSIDPEPEETILRGAIVDQAELYGLLSRLRNKGLTLISVQQIRQSENGNRHERQALNHDDT